MTYQPTNWKTGDVITEGKLNNIESGITNNDSQIEIIQSNENDLYGEVSSLQADLVNKQDKLTAGTGIDITDNIISTTTTSGIPSYDYNNALLVQSGFIAPTSGLLEVWIGSPGANPKYDCTFKINNQEFYNAVSSTAGVGETYPLSTGDTLTIVAATATVKNTFFPIKEVN